MCVCVCECLNECFSYSCNKERTSNKMSQYYFPIVFIVLLEILRLAQCK